MASVIGGEAVIEGARAPAVSVAVLANDGDAVRIANTSAEDVDVLVLAGEPLGEPVARYGPFVMNTREELAQAFEDYRAGKMGPIVA